MDPDSFLSEIFETIEMHTLTWNIILPLGCALLLLGISAFVSMSKAAFFSLSPHDISEIKKSSYFADSLIQKLLASPEYLSATISLVNKTANVAFILFCVYSFSLWFNFSKAPVLCFIMCSAISVNPCLVIRTTCLTFYTQHYSSSFTLIW